MKTIKFIFLILVFCHILEGQDYVKTEVPYANFTTSFYDSIENCLYAGGNILIKFIGTSWSYLTKPDPNPDIISIIKYKNELYVAVEGGFFNGSDFVNAGVFRFDGSKWENINAPYTEYIKDLFIYDNELYVFHGSLQDSLFVWNGINWNKIDPGVSSIGCRGISNMYYYNSELYANSSAEIDGYASVIIKKTSNTWSFPNGIHFNTGGEHSCVFQNKLYLTNGDRLNAYNGSKWETLGFAFHYGGYGSDYITSIRSNDAGLFVCGKIDIVHTVNWEDVSDYKGYMRANNLVMLCGEGKASPLDAGLEFVADVNFFNNRIYAFGDNYFSVLNDINVLPNPQISIKDTTLCEFESIEITEQSNSGIIWYWQIDDTKVFNTQHLIFYYLKPGVYSPKITVSNCAGDSTVNYDSLIIVHDNPIPTIEVVGDTFYSSSQYNNKWFLYSDGDNVLIDTTNSIVFPDSIAGRYIYVVVTNEFGCTSQSSWIPTSIDSYNSQNNALIFPNPSYGIFRLDLNSEISNKNGQLYVEIFDLNGRKINRFALTEINNNIDLSYLKKGTYFARIINNSSVIVKKIIIK